MSDWQEKDLNRKMRNQHDKERSKPLKSYNSFHSFGGISRSEDVDKIRQVLTSPRAAPSVKTSYSSLPQASAETTHNDIPQVGRRMDRPLGMFPANLGKLATQKNRPPGQTMDFNNDFNSPLPSLRQSSASDGPHINKFLCMPVASNEPPETSLAMGSGANNIEKNRLQPQNLRGDQFRRSKVKSELCRNFLTKNGCPFGEKCNYAHGEHELKQKKIMDRERDGDVDIEIYRTHPCMIWVATGSCPFDQRCLGIHDPRLASDEFAPWLPYLDALIGSAHESGLAVTVDKLYHQNLASVYSCSPVYGYYPKKKWTTNVEETKRAYEHLCDHLTLYENTTQPSHFAPSPQKIGPRGSRNSSISELHCLAISLMMRKQRLGQSYRYCPTHLFCKELCMILQTRTFRLREVDELRATFPQAYQDICSSLLVEIEDRKESNGKRIEPSNQRSNTVIAHEIAFGPVGDPSVRPVSIYIGIPSKYLCPCTRKEAKQHKKSRHRLRNKAIRLRLTKNSPVAPASEESGETIGRSDDSLNTIIRLCDHQPLDNATFELITSIISNRLHALWLVVIGRLKRTRDNHTMKSFVLGHTRDTERLVRAFGSLRQHWRTFSWPVCRESIEIDEDTEVPPVNRTYDFDVNNTALFPVFFHGEDIEPGEDDIISKSAKQAVEFIWNSFITNMHIFKDRHFQEPIDQSDLNRLPVLRKLSLGIKVSESFWHIPRLNGNCQKGSISSILEDWENVYSHYKQKQTRPLWQSHSQEVA